MTRRRGGCLRPYFPCEATSRGLGWEARLPAQHSEPERVKLRSARIWCPPSSCFVDVIVVARSSKIKMGSPVAYSVHTCRTGLAALRAAARFARTFLTFARLSGEVFALDGRMTTDQGPDSRPP